jgi:hypothetical protein
MCQSSSASTVPPNSAAQVGGGEDDDLSGNPHAVIFQRMPGEIRREQPAGIER